jgi:hypothetical protein
MPNTFLTLSRRALAASAVVVLAAVTACSESPTAPDGAPRAGAASGLAKQRPGHADAARGRRGGYNVVAD